MFDDGRRTYLDDAELLRLAHRDPAAFRVLYDRMAQGESYADALAQAN